MNVEKKAYFSRWWTGLMASIYYLPRTHLSDNAGIKKDVTTQPEET
jgi:hypothetical protein